MEPVLFPSSTLPLWNLQSNGEVDVTHQRIMQIRHGCEKCHEAKSTVKTQIGRLVKNREDSGFQDQFP